MKICVCINSNLAADIFGYVSRKYNFWFFPKCYKLSQIEWIDSDPFYFSVEEKRHANQTLNTTIFTKLMVGRLFAPK